MASSRIHINWHIQGQLRICNICFEFFKIEIFQIQYLIFFIGRVGRYMLILNITDLWSEIIGFSTVTSWTIVSENWKFVKSRVWPWRWVGWRTCCIRSNASSRLSSCWACWSFSWFSTWKLKSPMSASSPVEIDKPSRTTVKSAIKAPPLNLLFTEGGGRYKTIKRAHLPFDLKRSSKCSNDWNDSVCCLFMSMLFLYNKPTPPALPWVRGRCSRLYPVGDTFFNSSISAVCTKPSFSHTKHLAFHEQLLKRHNSHWIQTAPSPPNPW